MDENIIRGGHLKDRERSRCPFKPNGDEQGFMALKLQIREPHRLR